MDLQTDMSPTLGLPSEEYYEVRLIITSIKDQSNIDPTSLITINLNLNKWTADLDFNFNNSIMTKLGGVPHFIQ